MGTMLISLLFTAPSTYSQQLTASQRCCVAAAVVHCGCVVNTWAFCCQEVRGREEPLHLISLKKNNTRMKKKKKRTKVGLSDGGL